MANYGRTWSGTNRGGSQSRLAHKGVGTNQFTGGANAQGTATQATPPQTQQAQPGPAMAPAPAWSGKPGHARQPAPGQAPLPSNNATTPNSPGQTAPPAVVSGTTGATGSTSNNLQTTANQLPIDIEAMIQQIMQSAFGKVAEARTHAEAQQQQAFQMIQSARDNAMTNANQRVQQALSQVQARIGQIRF